MKNTPERTIELGRLIGKNADKRWDLIFYDGGRVMMVNVRKVDIDERANTAILSFYTDNINDLTLVDLSYVKEAVPTPSF